MKRSAILSFLLLITSLFNACVASQPASTPATDTTDAAPATGTARGILHMPHQLTWAGKESLDPASPTNFEIASPLLYDRLVRLDEQGKPQPELATAWEANADATEWTFTLQERVTFHDGNPFTADDVLYTFQHILDPAVESPAAAALNLVAEVTAPDAQTVLFQLSQGHADFPLLVSNHLTGIVPANSPRRSAPVASALAPSS